MSKGPNYQPYTFRCIFCNATQTQVLNQFRNVVKCGYCNHTNSVVRPVTQPFEPIVFSCLNAYPKRSRYEAYLEAFFIYYMQNATNFIETLNMRLKIRLELFKRVPSATNMLLAYNLVEEITLKTFASGNVEMNDRLIEKFDKLKNLALNTKFIEERKLAFERSVEIFEKLTRVSV